MDGHGVQAGRMLLSVPETADLLGVGQWLVWRLVHSGELPSTRVGRFVRVYLRDVTAYLERNRQRVE